MSEENEIELYLGVISMNHALFSRMEEVDFQRAKEQMQEDIGNYYKNFGYKEIGITPCVFNGIPGVNLVCIEKKLDL